MDIIGVTHDMENMPATIDVINKAITKHGRSEIKIDLELTKRRGFMNDFFKKVDRYVEDINMNRKEDDVPKIKVVYLDSLHGFETSGKLSVEANHEMGDPKRKRELADYVDVVLRTDRMERTIRREKPDIVLVGNGHALQLEKRFRVQATFIGGVRANILRRNIEKIRASYKIKRERVARKRAKLKQNRPK